MCLDVEVEGRGGLPTPYTIQYIHASPHTYVRAYVPDVDELGLREELVQELQPRRVRRRLEDQPL